MGTPTWWCPDYRFATADCTPARFPACPWHSWKPFATSKFTTGLNSNSNCGLASIAVRRFLCVYHKHELVCKGVCKRQEDRLCNYGASEVSRSDIYGQDVNPVSCSGPNVDELLTNHGA